MPKLKLHPAEPVHPLDPIPFRVPGRDPGASGRRAQDSVRMVEQAMTNVQGRLNDVREAAESLRFVFPGTPRDDGPTRPRAA